MEYPQAVDILLVEDNLQDAELTIRALRKRNLANRLHHVEDGVAALDFLYCRAEFSGREPCERPRIILLDLKLPKLGGLEVLKIIKEDPQTRTIPVVVVTSSNQDPDIAAAYALGANSYVVKPVNFEDFFDAVSQLGFYWLMLNQPVK